MLIGTDETRTVARTGSAKSPLVAPVHCIAAGLVESWSSALSAAATPDGVGPSGVEFCESVAAGVGEALRGGDGLGVLGVGDGEAEALGVGRGEGVAVGDALANRLPVTAATGCSVDGGASVSGGAAGSGSAVAVTKTAGLVGAVDTMSVAEGLAEVGVGVGIAAGVDVLRVGVATIEPLGVGVALAVGVGAGVAVIEGVVGGEAEPEVPTAGVELTVGVALGGGVGLGVGDGVGLGDGVGAVTLNR